MPDVTPVAIIQARPEYYDLGASLEKAISLIEEAARSGAKLIALGETWLPGYPAWLDYCPGAALWDHEPTRLVYTRLYENSVRVPGNETRTLGSLCRKLGVTLVIGVNERVDRGPGNGTIYNSLLTFGPEGVLENHHRKLTPTYTEKLVWGQGDGQGLRTVESPVGHIGGLICWEHWMPHARQAIHDCGEQIHVAVFPAIKDTYQIASRHYAFEGRAFTLAVGSVMLASDLPTEFDAPTGLEPDQMILNGGSAIIAPDARYIVGPIYDEETILTAELDLTEITGQQLTLDVSGHYARRDVFKFEVNRARR